MGDNEENASNPEDDQEANETDGRDEQPPVSLRRPAEEEPGVAAPADDDIIIK